MIKNVYREVWNLPPSRLRDEEAQLRTISHPHMPFKAFEIDINYPGQGARKVGVVIRDNPEAYSSLTDEELKFLLNQIAETILVMIDDNLRKYSIPLPVSPEEYELYRDYFVELITTTVNGEVRYIANISAKAAPKKSRPQFIDDDDEIDPADFWK